MELPDLLQWLATSVKTGKLLITNGRIRKQIFFVKGNITACSSNAPREFLGQFLLSNRAITEDQLRQAMETQRSTGILLGKILVMVGAITEENLRKMLLRQAEETLFALFFWKDGSFEFTDEEVPEGKGIPLKLKVENILLEGLRRYDELQVILKSFPRGEMVALARTRKPVPEKLAANGHVQRFLETVDGKRTLTDICLELHASEFAISRIAFELHRLGCVRVVTDERGGSGQPSESSDSLLAQAEEMLESQRLEEALDFLGRALDLRPSDLALKSKLEEVETAFLERAYRHYLPPDQIPAVAKPLEELTNENLTPQEVFLVSRINGSWTVKDVVTISPMREVETLRALKQLREKGIVAIHQSLPAQA